MKYLKFCLNYFKDLQFLKLILSQLNLLGNHIKRILKTFVHYILKFQIRIKGP